jgi:hypothetical protein
MLKGNRLIDGSANWSLSIFGISIRTEHTPFSIDKVNTLFRGRNIQSPERIAIEYPQQMGYTNASPQVAKVSILNE